MKELLAEPDTLRITTPVLPRETLERVLEIIRKDISSGEVRVDNPTQNLESYFLAVVAKARSAGETSGAQSGARVAEYLRAGERDKPASDKLLEKLSLPTAGMPPAAPIAAPAASEPTVDEHKLAALSQAGTPEPPAPKTVADPAPDLAKANEKLSSLLGKKND